MLKPTRGFVLVEQIDETQTTASGLVLPETAQDKPIKGVVIEVGGPKETWYKGEMDKGYWITERTDINVGDKVVYKKWSTTDLEENGKKLSFVAFQDILGVYE